MAALKDEPAKPINANLNLSDACQAAKEHGKQLHFLPKVELQLEEALDKVCCQEDMVGSVSDDQLRKNAFELSKVDANNLTEKWKSALMAVPE